MMNGFNGKKVTHSRATPMTSTAPARMPAAQPKAKMNPPTGHTCKVCPGASRKR